jgi:hypothetical protein
VSISGAGATASCRAGGVDKDSQDQRLDKRHIIPMSGESIAASIVLLRHRSSKRSAAVVHFSVEGEDEAHIQGLRVAPGVWGLKGVLSFLKVTGPSKALL